MTPTLRDLERFFVNNYDLDRIRTHLNRFNPIKTMGLEQRELTHSNILCWLFDPQESHGLGDRFLKSFIAEALQGHEADHQPSALEISHSNMMDAEVRREWFNIDILVLSEQKHWVFVIENKLRTTQHGEQLQRYMNYVKERFGKDYRYGGVFLTLSDEKPEDDRYAPIRYKVIGELIERLQKQDEHFFSPDVKTFIRHYLEIIEENTGTNKERSELEERARHLYAKHRKVIEFVVKSGKNEERSELEERARHLYAKHRKVIEFVVKSGKSTFSLAAEDVFGEKPGHPLSDKTGRKFICVNKGPRYAEFVPRRWFDGVGGKEGFESRNRDMLPLYFRLELFPNYRSQKNDGWIGLQTRFGSQRELIEKIRGVSKSYKLRKVLKREKKTDRRGTQKWYTIDDIYDDKLISTTMKKALRKFQPEAIDAVAEIISQYCEHGQQEEESV